LDSSDRDKFLANTYVLSSAIVFLAALSSYYLMGGCKTRLLNDMMEKPCSDTSSPEDDPEYNGNDEEPWYKPAPGAYKLDRSETRNNIAKNTRTRGRSTTPRNEVLGSDSEPDEKAVPLSPRNEQAEEEDPVIVEAAESTDTSSRDEDYYKPPAYVYS
jgi:vancomycin resistance protein YoaR